MTLDELVRNLKTYEINIEGFKKGETSKEQILALKENESQG